MKYQNTIERIRPATQIIGRETPKLTYDIFRMIAAKTELRQNRLERRLRLKAKLKAVFSFNRAARQKPLSL